MSVPREILQKVRRIEIRTRSVVESVLSGTYHSAFKGRGMEFSEVREYTEGDDIRFIDWNVTARSGKLHVKKHVEERELTVMLVVDASASGNFGSAGKFKAEVGVELCALLAFSAIKNNDRVGLIIFTDTVEKYIPPKKGRNHVLRVIRELLFFEPQGRKTDIALALRFLNRVQRRRAVVFMVSDFFCADYSTPLRIASRRHDFVALGLQDRREREIPAMGLIDLLDPETGRTVCVNSSSRRWRRAFTAAAARRERERLAFFRTNRIDYIPLMTDADYIEPLVRFFRTRERTAA